MKRALLLLASLVVSMQTRADVFVVNTTADTEDPNDGVMSLREAILAANQTTAKDTIAFNIDNASFGGPPHTIFVAIPSGFPLPLILYPIEFDGTSEPDYMATSSIAVIIDGSSVLQSNGYKRGLHFEYETSGSRVRALTVRNFPQEGIALYSNDCYVEQNLIENNWTGIVVSGQINNHILNNRIVANSVDGIFLYGGNAQSGHNHVISNFLQSNGKGINISGPLNNVRDNVIIDSQSNGINVAGPWANDNTIRGNFIGTDATDAKFGNQGHGILINSSGTRVGGFDIRRDNPRNFAENVIAYNGGDGVRVDSGVDNTIRGNSIHDNAGLGIDLEPAGVTTNDAQDPDTGANNLQNFPNIQQAIASGNATVVWLEFPGAAKDTFAIDFYTNTQGDSSGHGEGEKFLATYVLTTPPLPSTMLAIVNLPPIAAGTHLTATATSSNGDTSEFSGAKLVERR